MSFIVRIIFYIVMLSIPKWRILAVRVFFKFKIISCIIEQIEVLPRKFNFKCGSRVLVVQNMSLGPKVPRATPCIEEGV